MVRKCGMTKLSSRPQRVGPRGLLVCRRRRGRRGLLPVPIVALLRLLLWRSVATILLRRRAAVPGALRAQGSATDLNLAASCKTDCRPPSAQSALCSTSSHRNVAIYI